MAAVKYGFIFLILSKLNIPNNGQANNGQPQKMAHVQSSQLNSLLQDGQKPESLKISSSAKIPQNQLSINQYQSTPTKFMVSSSDGNPGNNDEHNPVYMSLPTFSQELQQINNTPQSSSYEPIGTISLPDKNDLQDINNAQKQPSDDLIDNDLIDNSQSDITQNDQLFTKIKSISLSKYDLPDEYKVKGDPYHPKSSTISEYDTQSLENSLDDIRPTPMQVSGDSNLLETVLEDSITQYWNELDKSRIYANPQDINLLNLPPVQSQLSTMNIHDNSGSNNINKFNSQSTPTSWFFNSPPNNFDYQQLNSNTYQLPPNELFHSHQNRMTYNQKPALNNYHNFLDTSSFINQNQMISNILPNINDQSDSTDNGNMYKVDTMNPSPYPTSWSLLKHDYSKKQQPNQYDYSSIDNSRLGIFETPSTLHQNNNMQKFSNQPSSNDMSLQYLTNTMSNEAQIPSYGTEAIFEMTKKYFPYAPESQQISLTRAVIQSTMLALRKMLNTVISSLFSQRVKRDFNIFSQFSSLIPETTKDIFSFPSSSTLTKKDHRQSTTSLPTATNTNLYFNQPMTTASNVYQTTTTSSESQPNAVNTMQLQHMYDGRGTNTYISGLQNNIGVAQPITNLREYVFDGLADEIRKAINLNLPDSYTSNSPEVKDYIRQIILVDRIVFQDQINNVLQGNSPNMNRDYDTMSSTNY